MNPIAAALLFGGESGGSSDPIVASSVNYDGTSSGLSSENVQDAIDEVNEKIEELPKPMLYKGTLGTGGTITSLPTASPANEGYVYKVKTENDYILDTVYYRVAFLVSTGNVSADKSMDPDFSNIVDSVSVAAPRYNGVAFVFDDNKLEVGTKDATSSFGGNIYVKSLINGVHYNNNVYNAGEIMASGNKASNRNWEPITYGPSIHAKVGDMFISNGAEWTHIPSGDDMVIADEVTYDNTSSSLSSENVQDAIDEIKTLLDSVETEAEAAQIPTLTKSQYDALTEAQKTDGTLREVKDYTFDGDIKVVYSKAFGNREYYGKVTDEYYVTDEEEYKTGLKAHVVMDYYSIQTGYHTQKEYFDAQGISSTNNGLIAISGVDHNYNDGRSALYLNTYGNNKFDSYNSQNKNVAAYWENSTGSGIASEGTPDGKDGSNQRDGYTSFSYNIPIFATQAEAATYVTTGEGLNKAVNYKNSKKSTVLIRNKEVVGITDSNALPFDGTGSDLSSTNAADAIKEVNSKIPSDIQAEDVSYDNTTSGLTATDVNSAIDEVLGKIGDSYNLNLLETEVDTKMTFLGKKIYALVTDADSPKIEITKSGSGVHFAGNALLFPDVSGVKPSWVEIHPEGFAQADLIYDESRSTTKWYNGRWNEFDIGQYSGSWSFLSINEGGFTFIENYQTYNRSFSYVAKFYVDITPNVDTVLLKHEVEDANYIIYLYTKVTN